MHDEDTACGCSQRPGDVDTDGRTLGGTEGRGKVTPQTACSSAPVLSSEGVWSQTPGPPLLVVGST